MGEGGGVEGVVGAGGRLWWHFLLCRFFVGVFSKSSMLGDSVRQLNPSENKGQTIRKAGFLFVLSHILGQSEVSSSKSLLEPPPITTQMRWQ